MISLCRYILQGGNQCQQAAINGEYYCRHHLVVRRTVKAATSTRPDPYRVDKSLPLVFPDDRAAHQLNVFMVMQAFNTGEISPRSAKVFALLLHECGVNLKKGPLYETNHENAVRSVEVTPEGEEIGPAREVPEAGLRAQGSGLREGIPPASGVPETGLRAQGAGLREEIPPAREVPEAGTRAQGAGLREEIPPAREVPETGTRDQGPETRKEIAHASEVPETGLRAQGAGLREEIPPAREVPEENEAVSGERVSEEEDGAVKEEAAIEENPTSQNRDPSASSGQVVGHPHPVSDKNVPSLPVPHTSKGGLCRPPTEEVWTQGDFACNDPCYIANLTERREQYRAFALNDLAAGRDPRAWEDFIPGKSRMRRPKRRQASVELAAK